MGYGTILIPSVLRTDFLLVYSPGLCLPLKFASLFSICDALPSMGSMRTRNEIKGFGLTTTKNTYSTISRLWYVALFFVGHHDHKNQPQSSDPTITTALLQIETATTR